MILYKIILSIGLYLAIGFMLRSLFYVITSRKNHSKINTLFWILVLIPGIIHFLYAADRISETPTTPGLIMFILGASIAIYNISKSKGVKSYLITQQVKDIYTGLAKKFSPSIGKEETINYEVLEGFKMGVTEWIEGMAIVRYPTAFYGLFFQTVFPPDYEMNKQRHSDCKETCFIIEGEMIDTLSGKTYKKGDVAIFNPGEWHKPKNNRKNEKLTVHVYFKKV